tara:strand:+ start:490 stop:1101 length:612 start_codon:yes stop_codon:yes gene_type:complete
MNLGGKVTEEVPIYALDTCIVIDAIQEHRKWGPEIEPVLSDAQAGLVRILVSEITVAEACKLTKGDLSEEERANQVRAIDEFFRNSYILRRAVTSRESNLAAKLIREHNIDTCDSIIAATSLLHGATCLYTHDGLKANGKKKKLSGLDGKLEHNGATLSIEQPNAAKYKGHELWAASDESEGKNEQQEIGSEEAGANARDTQS